MYCTILIFCVLSAIKMSVSNDYCEFDNTGLSKCHDGGCNIPQKLKLNNTDQICWCLISDKVMKGKYCGVYENKCLKNPCINNAECMSGIGHHVCKCSDQFHGGFCEIPIKKGMFTDY